MGTGEASDRRMGTGEASDRRGKQEVYMMGSNAGNAGKEGNTVFIEEGRDARSARRRVMCGAQAPTSARRSVGV